jgi:hypothetical protein
MTHFNGIMQETCTSEDCIFLDEVLSVPWENKHFEDAGHFSPGGGDVFSEILARRIRRLEPAPNTP